VEQAAAVRVHFFRQLALMQLREPLTLAVAAAELGMVLALIVAVKAALASSSFVIHKSIQPQL